MECEEKRASLNVEFYFNSSQWKQQRNIKKGYMKTSCFKVVKRKSTANQNYGRKIIDFIITSVHYLTHLNKRKYSNLQITISWTVPYLIRIKLKKGYHKGYAVRD